MHNLRSLSQNFLFSVLHRADRKQHPHKEESISVNRKGSGKLTFTNWTGFSESI